MIKLFIQSIYPAPYRVGVFNQINKSQNIDADVVFENNDGDNRNKAWFEKNIEFKNIILNNKQNMKLYKNKIKNIKKYDFVLAYDYASIKSITLLLKCCFWKIPYIINCDGAIIKRNFIKDAIKKFFIKRARACFANGKSAKDYFLKYGAKEENIYFHKFSSLYEKEIRQTIIDRQEKLEMRKKMKLPYERLYISVGSFVDEKGFDLLIEAVNKLDRNNKIGFIIIGGGEKEKEYIARVNQYGIENMHFEKFKKKEELIKYYDASDVFVFPTKRDVWGLVVNEAMSRGLPIISTDNCMAAVELVEEGINGNIIKANSTEDLVDIINKYNKMDFSEFEKYGEKSLDKIKEYTIENIAKSHLEVLEKLSKEEK